MGDEKTNFVAIFFFLVYLLDADTRQTWKPGFNPFTAGHDYIRFFPILLSL